MMNSQTISEALGLKPDSVIHLTGLQLRGWGRELIFEGTAGEMTRFRLLLLDCREARWQWYSHIELQAGNAFPPVAIVDLRLGRDQHRSPLRLLTDSFGLVLSYGQLRFEEFP
jgi:hypothetical protein